MTRLPIDHGAPIACTAGATDLAGRRAQLEGLRVRLRSAGRSETGLVLRFPPDAAVRSAVERFVADEAACCRFWGFEVAVGDDLALRWDGPPQVQPLLDELLHHLRSDQPFPPLDGLL